MNPIKNLFLKRITKRIIKDLEYESYYKNDYVFKIYGTDMKNDYTFQNAHCFNNAYDKYKRDKDKKFVACLSVNEHKELFIHFINYSEEEDKFYDDTYGGNRVYYTYYIFSNTLWIYEKIFKEGKNFNPSDIITIVRNDLYDKYIPNFFERLFISKNDF